MNVFIKVVVLLTSLSGLLASCSDEISVASGSSTSESEIAVVGAISLNNTSVLVSFSVEMSDSAVDPTNYSIVAENVTSEAGALSITGVSFFNDDHKAVILTTRSQNEIAYRVTVVNVQDINGQSFQVTASNTGYYTANNASFAGTPSGGISVIDTDGDGLPDNEEQRGWLVAITNGNGQVTVREVTSDPTLVDTDGDGLPDSIERSLNLDPRSRDTDSDLLGDAHEYNGIFSSPSDQDSDNDGLMDGEEVNFYKTSPLLVDTDGDQIMDGDEIILANRNARIADLAQPTIEIESIYLELDVRFDETLNKETTAGTENIVSTTLTQSNTKTHAKTNEENNKVSASATAATEFDISPFTAFIPKSKIQASATAGVEHGWSSSWSSESSKATQNEYNKSLTTTKALAEGTTVSRRIESAKVSTLVYLAAAGDVAFTIRDLQITALVADIRNPGKYLPVATLIPENPDGTLANSFNLGPLADKIGPLVFTGKDIFPVQVERLMRDPSGVIFKISNYNITDEDGRNFAYSSQDVVDRTSSISLDFGGADQTGTAIGEGTEFYRVATSFGRTIGSIADAMAAEQQMTPAEVKAAYGLAADDVDSLISYDLSGKNVGVVFHDVMQNVLGLKHYDSASDIPASNASGRLASYATTFNANGVERITRIRQIENGTSRQWALLSPSGLILDAQLSFGAGDIKADDQVLLPGSGISLAYVTDEDGDGIPARLEYLYGCSDSGLDTNNDSIADGIDTDGDGLSDYLEVFGAAKNSDGSYVNIDDKWTVDVKAIGTYQGFSSCGSKDTDADGIPDFNEYNGFDAVTTTVNLDGSVTNTFAAYTGTNPPPRTDAKSQDTDGDGITDFDERKGYIAYLEFPRVTSGTDPSECTDEVDDTVDGRDKVRCTSDPLNPDTDGDVLLDGAEFAFFADPTVKDAGDISDVDGDGLLGREEADGWPVTFIYSGKADFYKTWDINGYVIPPVLIGTEQVLNNQYLPFVEVTCDPALAASDNGCTTFTTAEIDRGIYKGYYLIPTYNGKLSTSSPIIQDTDGDGLLDNIENDISLANTGYLGSTHPREVDTDQDGRPDFEELYGYPYKDTDLDPLKIYQGTSGVPVKTDPLKYDTDGDGRSDGEEVNTYWLVDLVGVSESPKVYSNPADGNIDNDGLNDSEEYDNGTDPNKDNTDATNEVYPLTDGQEVRLGLDPLNSGDMCVRVKFGSYSVHLAGGIVNNAWFYGRAELNSVIAGQATNHFTTSLDKYITSASTYYYDSAKYVRLSPTNNATVGTYGANADPDGNSDHPYFADITHTLTIDDFASTRTITVLGSATTSIGAGTYSFNPSASAEVINEQRLNELLILDPNETFCQGQFVR